MDFAIEARNITKSYGGRFANQNVDLRVRSGSIHAILGENGAGKTTLVKSIFGLVVPDSGEIRFHGTPVKWRGPKDAIRAGLGMVQQHFRLVDSLSVVENVILGQEPIGPGPKIDFKRAVFEIEKRLPSEILRLPWFAKTEDLSIGQKQKLEIVKLLYANAQVLVLDEPTAVLTPQEVKEFFSVLLTLKSQQRTIVIITHKLDEVFAVCDEYTVLRGGRVTGAGEVPKATHKSLVELIVGNEMPSLPEYQAKPRGELLLQVKHLTEKRAGRGALKSISFEVRSREILGIAGVEGSGQTELMEIIFGLRTALGEMTLLGSPKDVWKGVKRDQRVGFVPPDRHRDGFWLDASNLENAVIGLIGSLAHRGWIDWRKISGYVETWIKRFRVEGPGLNFPTRTLSGGNQQKLLFAREVAGRNPKLLICAHPTRGIDLGAVDLVHRELLSLRDRGVGILLISGDLDELFALSDRMHVAYEGELIGEWSRENFDREKIGLAMTRGAT